MLGPLWVTSPQALSRVGIPTSVYANIEDGKVLLTSFLPLGDQIGINMGWRWFEKGDTEIGETLAELKDRFLFDGKLSSKFWNRTAILNDFMFEQIVNDHLEIRTSVAIDPKTGAAEETALFSFEALPRSTVLTFDLTLTDPAYFKINGEDLQKKSDSPSPLSLDDVLTNARLGFDYLPILGLGGMGSRGLGRVAIIADQGEVAA
jgi:CRISPR-associated protein Cmr4